MIHLLCLPVLAVIALVMASDAADSPAAPGAMAVALPSDSVLLRNFAIVALEREHERIRDPRITKWTGPLRVRVREEAPLPPDARAFLRNHFHRLGRLTGLAVRFVSDDASANFLIVATRRARFAGHIRAALSADRRNLASRLVKANCAGMYRNDAQSSEIVSATVIIPVEYARSRGLLRRCIVEETTQVLGLPNDSSIVVPSAFNDASSVRDLTRHDEFLLRLLYQPRMRPGLRREEALSVARDLIPEVRRAMAGGRRGGADRAEQAR